MLNRKFAKSVSARFRNLEGLPLAARGLLAGFGLISLAFAFYSLLFWGRIYPGVAVSGISVSGVKPEEAKTLLSEKIIPPRVIFLKAEGQSFEIPLEDIEFSYDFAGSVERAYNLDRTGNTLFDILARIKAPTRKVNFGLRIKISEEKLSEHLSVVAGQISVEPVFPSAELSSGQIIISPGKSGSEVNLPALRVLIGKGLAFSQNEPLKIPTKNLDPSLKEEEVALYKARVEKFLRKTFSLKFEEGLYTYKTEEIIKFIEPKGEYRNEAIGKLASSLADEINRKPENPILVFSGSKVKEFSPAKEGVEVNVSLLKEMIVGNLRTLEETEKETVSVDIPANITSPAIKTADINNLGINELIGRGKSRFSGSIASRVHNITLASSLFNGVLIKPGETFSFNDTLGDVSIYTGYKQAYIIKDGKTILGDGGGVCQVSTTFFRATLDAGLPIVERRAHSYRVVYYEQDSPPGLDATVYAPTTDFKFRNDTPGHLLIQTSVDPKSASLVFEIYGTNDRRISTVTKSLVTNVTPPPEDLYQADPSLPAGTLKQIDYKAWGAKVSFNYFVERGGEMIYEKTFISNYRPWQAVFLRGTGPVN